MVSQDRRHFYVTLWESAYIVSRECHREVYVNYSFVLRILGDGMFDVDTLLDNGVYRVQCSPSATHKQIHCYPPHMPPLYKVRQLIIRSRVLIILVNPEMTSICISLYLSL